MLLGTSVLSALRRQPPSVSLLLRAAIVPMSSCAPNAHGFANAAGADASPSLSRGSTVDATELRKFEAIAAQWWRPDGPFAGLHQMNPVRVQLVRRAAAEMFGDTSADSSPGVVVGSPLRGLRVVDIGCGGGILSEALARLGADVTGIDAAAANVKAATAHSLVDPRLQQNLRYVNTTAEALLADRGAESFDVVVCSEVLEHVHDARLFLECAAAMVKPGGALVVTTINRTVKAFLGGILAAEYVGRLVPAGTHEWAKFVRPQEVKEILEGAHLSASASPSSAPLTVVETVGLMYNPVLGRWSIGDGSTADTDINYGLVARKHRR